MNTGVKNVINGSGIAIPWCVLFSAVFSNGLTSSTVLCTTGLAGSSGQCNKSGERPHRSRGSRHTSLDVLSLCDEGARLVMHDVFWGILTYLVLCIVC